MGYLRVSFGVSSVWLLCIYLLLLLYYTLYAFFSPPTLLCDDDTPREYTQYIPIVLIILIIIIFFSLYRNLYTQTYKPEELLKQAFFPALCLDHSPASNMHNSTDCDSSAAMHTASLDRSRDDPPSLRLSRSPRLSFLPFFLFFLHFFFHLSPSLHHPFLCLTFFLLFRDTRGRSS